MKYVQLNTGDSIPPIGFGTWQLTPDEHAKDAVAQAIAAGYRLIDTAKLYGNERGVGEAVRTSSVPRQEIFITTKLWNDDQGYGPALKAFDASLERLGFDYVDLYLIHWPATEQRRDAWRALEALHASGRAKAIGVSNYNVGHLQEVLNEGSLVPAVNQIEYHPYNRAFQQPTVDFCARHGIAVQAYSPLKRFVGEGNDRIERIAQALGRTPAQVILRWCLHHGVIPLPRSGNPDHIRSNFEVFDFELSTADIEVIDGLSI